ncbi:MAG TPA: hypothetical protein VME70_00925 [Mycobacteriales bacterium]|nr:hypothetical protein [Mycobacteriales bacterium]
MLKIALSRRAAVLVASAGVVVAVAGVAIPGAQASSLAKKAPSSIEVNSPTITIRTTAHHKLRLKIGGTDFVSNGHPDDSPAAAYVELRTPSGHEAHNWTFQLSSGSFTDHVAKSTGGFTTDASQIAPYGRIRLAFSPMGSGTTIHCGKTTVVTRHVKVAAALSFVTGTSWGDLGSFPSKTHFGRGTLRTQYGGAPCPRPSPFVPCMSNLSWNSSQSPVTIAGGWTMRKGKKHGEVSGVRLALLSTPAEAIRTDTVVTTAPAPAYSDSGGIPTVAVTTYGGQAAGSATLTSTTVEHPGKVTCDSKHHHDRQTTWSTASYTNGTTPLTLHEQIEGPMTLPDSSSDGYIQRNTRLN